MTMDVGNYKWDDPKDDKWNTTLWWVIGFVIIMSVLAGLILIHMVFN